MCFLKEKINAQKPRFLASRPQREAADKLSLLYIFGVSIDESIFVLGRVFELCAFFYVRMFFVCGRSWRKPSAPGSMRSAFKTLPRTIMGKKSEPLLRGDL